MGKGRDRRKRRLQRKQQHQTQMGKILSIKPELRLTASPAKLIMTANGGSFDSEIET